MTSALSFEPVINEVTALLSSDPGLYRGRYVEVTAMERTASGKLRHPKFKCFRDIAGSEGVKS